jgi:hypothetical protein
MGDMDQGLEYIAKQNIPDLLEVSDEEYFGDLDHQRQPHISSSFPWFVSVPVSQISISNTFAIGFSNPVKLSYCALS